MGSRPDNSQIICLPTYVPLFFMYAAYSIKYIHTYTHTNILYTVCVHLRYIYHVHILVYTYTRMEK